MANDQLVRRTCRDIQQRRISARYFTSVVGIEMEISAMTGILFTVAQLNIHDAFAVKLSLDHVYIAKQKVERKPMGSEEALAPSNSFLEASTSVSNF